MGTFPSDQQGGLTSITLHDFILLMNLLIGTLGYNEIQMILSIGTSGYNIRYISVKHSKVTNTSTLPLK